MSINSSTLMSRLETAKTSFKSLELQLADPDVASNPKELETIARERARLEPLVIDYEKLQLIEKEWKESKELLRESKDDKDMETLIQEEIKRLDLLKAELLDKLTIALLL